MTSYKCHWMAKAGELAESSVNFQDGRQKCQTVTGHPQDNDNRGGTSLIKGRRRRCFIKKEGDAKSPHTHTHTNSKFDGNRAQLTSTVPPPQLCAPPTSSCELSPQPIGLPRDGKADSPALMDQSSMGQRLAMGYEVEV